MKKFLIATIMAVFIGLSFGGATVLADDPEPDQIGVKAGFSAIQKTSLSQKNSNDIIKNTIDTLLFIVGMLSVVMVIYGAFLYVTSSGDANKVTTAKNVIIYSIVGLVIASFAYAIVAFVFNQIVT